MTIEERFGQVDFSNMSRVKNSLLIQLKLRRRAINEAMTLDELDQVAAAGRPDLRDDKKNYPCNK